MKFLMIPVALVCAYAMLWVFYGKLMAMDRRLSKLEKEIDRMWNRIEWLCKDTDDRLEFQQKSKQVRNLWKRLRYVEKKLYIEPSDAFKEKEDGE